MKAYLSNGLYDKIKFVALILLPAVGTLYFGVAGIWNLPAAEQVVGTIVAVDTFLGVLLGFSTSKYKEDKYAGDIVVEKNDDGSKMFSLELHSDPEDLDARQEVLFKVTPSGEEV